MFASGRKIRLKPSSEGGIDTSSSHINFTMPNKSVEGNIAIYDDTGNVYDSQSVSIQVEGLLGTNTGTIAAFGVIIAALIGSLALMRRKKKRKATQ